MDKSLTRSLAVLALLTLTLACSLGGLIQPATKDANTIATQVAGTVAAKLGPGATIVPNVPPTKVPTIPTTAPAEPPTSAPPPPTAPAPAVLRLYYTVAGGNLWTWTEADGSRQLASIGGVVDLIPSRDSTRVAYVRSIDYLAHSLWIVRSDGSDNHMLVSEAALKAMNTDTGAAGASPYMPTWLRDGVNLAFVSSPKFEGPGFTLNDDLELVNTLSGVVTRFLAPSLGGAFYYSPDDSKVALVKPGKISVMNADGSNMRGSLLTHPPINTASEYEFRAVPQWASNSASMWVAIPPIEPFGTSVQSTILWRVPVDGSPAIRLGEVPAFALNNVVLSPDGNRILYVSDGATAGDNITELHIANPDGGGDALFYTGNTMGGLQWALDSQHFLFSMGGGYNVYVGQVGGTPVLLSDTGMAAMPVWVNNTTCLFLNRTDSGWEIRRVNLGGGSSVLVSLPGDTSNFMPVYAFTD